MISPQYSRLAGASGPTAPISVAVVAAMLKAGAVPATPITTDSARPSACPSNSGGAFVVMVATPIVDVDPDTPPGLQHPVGTYSIGTRCGNAKHLSARQSDI
ncbi:MULTISPECIES: hypothetical protein [Ralstonia solanacearum species complex]|uniref:Uncharacterized protein n=1 Tax=Ralstonia solanacearum (strain UW551) TaxID=342110 RepID=A0AB33V8T2_RALSU|nr:hypothetical protein [Ralstonia solanacearum]ALF90547.1 hypothetical protein RSUY_42430 [Ralstonia solanacearum]EAP71332.1 Hypothetical Protein RRSL_00818 [Ralstonia solanacearum UW551]MDN4064577.1 hypothetical protein [Ralstonia solanacearum]